MNQLILNLRAHFATLEWPVFFLYFLTLMDFPTKQILITIDEVLIFMKDPNFVLLPDTTGRISISNDAAWYLKHPISWQNIGLTEHWTKTVKRIHSFSLFFSILIGNTFRILPVKIAMLHHLVLLNMTPLNVESCKYGCTNCKLLFYPCLLYSQLLH